MFYVVDSYCESGFAYLDPVGPRKFAKLQGRGWIDSLVLRHAERFSGCVYSVVVAGESRHRPEGQEGMDGDTLRMYAYHHLSPSKLYPVCDVFSCRD